jgi:perosamine synthetase
MIPVYSVYKAKNTEKYLTRVVEDNWFSYGGYFYDYAQSILKERLNAKYVLLTSNGTTATHLLAKILKNKRPIKNVVTQNGSYVAAWNSFLFDGDVSLSIADLDLDTWNVDEGDISKLLSECSPEETAISLVHNLGNPAQLDFGDFLVVEDNCEGLFGKYHNDLYTGAKCLASSVSFFANKNITCGEGGAVLTDDEESFVYATSLHGQGQSSKRYVHDRLGYNYRMTNLAAAVLCAQLEQVDEILEKKSDLFDYYKTALSSIEGVHFQAVEKGCTHSNWMFGIRVENSRYELAEEFFKDSGIEVRPMFYPASHHAHINSMISSGKVKISKEDVANQLNQECIVIPSYPDLTLSERNQIVETIKNYKKFTEDKDTN